MGKRIKLYSSQDFAEGFIALILVVLILTFAPDYWLVAIAISFFLFINIYKFFKAENKTLKWISEEPEKQLSYEEFYN